MSLEAMTWAWRQPVRGTQKLVLLALADHADAAWEAWPAIKSLAERCGVTPRAVRDAIRALEDGKLVVRTDRFRDNGSRGSNLYVLGTGSQLPEAPGSELPEDEGGRGSQLPEGRGSELPDLNPHGEPAGEKKEADASKEVDPIEDVWTTYVEVMEPRRRELDPESRRIIRDALKVADVAELKRAIVGNKASSFHQGANDRGKKYNALSQILKGKRGGRTTREQIDFFIEIADKSGASNPGLPSVDQAKLASAKRWVLTAWEYPGNAQAQAASKEATTWLQEHGYAVEHDPADGRPIFRWQG